MAHPNKGVLVASVGFEALFNQVSKAALIDALWCACQLGTDESDEQITTQAARNVQIALNLRGDRIPRNIVASAESRTDSDAQE